jgi:hypothetical protein
MAVERAVEARKQADKLACEAWTKRMLTFKGPAQPSPKLGDALNASYAYLEVRCFGRDTHQTFALDIARRPKTTPIHELERYMRCKDCSEVHGYPCKRSHLVALQRTNKQMALIDLRDPSFFRSGSMCSTIHTTSRHRHLPHPRLKLSQMASNTHKLSTMIMAAMMSALDLCCSPKLTRVAIRGPLNDFI